MALRMDQLILTIKIQRECNKRRESTIFPVLAHEGIEVSRGTTAFILISALYGAEWLSSRPGQFTSQGKTQAAHSIGGLVEMGKISCPYRDSRIGPFSL
jgi:hypothetical protein